MEEEKETDESFVKLTGSEERNADYCISIKLPEQADCSVLHRCNGARAAPLTCPYTELWDTFLTKKQKVNMALFFHI